MIRKFRLLLAALAFSGMAIGQNISLDWVHTEPFGVDNSFSSMLIDKTTNDIVSHTGNWMDQTNQVHADGLHRITDQGQPVWDTLFNDTSYLNYSVRAFYPTHGETYYCLNYQSSDLIFEKLNAAGQLLWQQQIPRATLFFSYDWNHRGNNYVIDDSLNNRMLWMFEQYNPSFSTKSIGILATDNTTGTITILDTLNHSGPLNNTAFAVELQRDNNNHVYMSSTDENGGMRISLLANGQLITVAANDSMGMTLRDYPQSMRIVGNTLFVTSLIEVSNSNMINKLRIYSIDNAGYLTLISEQNISDTQHFMMGMRTFNNNCYVFTSGHINFSYPSLTPTIWKYDNAGILQSTFTLPTFNTAFISDMAITSHAIYCSMYEVSGYNMLEAINPVSGQHLANYWLLTEFTAAGNDAVYQLEAYDRNATSDVIFAGGNQWVTNTHLVGRIAKYVFSTLENGAEELNADPVVTLFPNPASDALFVNYGKDNYLIELYDAMGKIVLTQKAATAQQVIDLRALGNGVYFIRIVDDAGVVVRRIVKE